MTNRSAVYFAACTLAGLLITPAMYAQNGRVQVDIPFAFAAGNKAMPAGTYNVQSENGRNLITLRSADNHAAGIFIGYAVQTKRPSELSKVVFSKYGDKYFLKSVWVAGSITGTEVAPSNSEREYTAQATSVTLLAHR